MRRTPTAVVALLVLLAAPAAAQEEQAKLPAWAPKWQVGDWWEVKTYQRDLHEAIESPRPAEGAMPASPDDPRTEPLPGFPPLRNGVPVGYKVGNTYRFEVTRQASIPSEDGEKDLPPEVFWVVTVQTLEGDAKRSAELWYAVADLALSKVVHDAGTPQASERWLRGTAQLDPAEGARLGFPLDWPDFAAAESARSQLPAPGRGEVEQRVRVTDAGTPNEEIRVLLTEVTDERSEARARAMFTWKPERPFWLRLMSGVTIAQTVKSGRK